MRMDKRTREKVALVVFALLVVFATVVLVGYFTTGRSWSVAASIVDDRVGRMDGYTVVAYAGVVEEEGGTGFEDPDVAHGRSEGDAVDPQSEQGSASSSASEATTASGGSSDLGASTGDAGPDGDPVAGVVESFGSFRPPLPDQDGSDAQGDESASDDSDSSVLDDASIGVGAASSIGLDVLALYADLVPSFSQGVYVSDVRQIYVDKGANALTIDLGRVLEDGVPVVYDVGGKRIGVYGADVYTSKAWLKHYMGYFADNDADIVVGVTPRTGYLATYEGTDVVIVNTDNEGVSTQGYFSDSTFVVRSPEKGDVGLVILTSNGTASSKVFKN